MDDTPGARFDRLTEVMRTLRSPNGCPWDREQTLRSLRPFVLEETYELLDALDRDDMDGLREELGDFLYEAVFLAQIAEEEQHFSISDAIQAITDKLVRRHPHVFTPDGRPLADAREEMTSADVIEKWEDLKARERQEAPGKQGANKEKTILSGIPRTLPALLRAYELSARAAAVGFDWEKATDVIAKIEEEIAEVKQELASATADPKRVEEEMGDLFFSLANLSRKLGVEPEAALRRANAKFQTRFEQMELQARRQGRMLRDLTLQELEHLWGTVKHEGHEEHEGHEDKKYELGS